MELEPEKNEVGKMVGLWGITDCEYRNWGCMAEAREENECGDDLVCWVVFFIKFPPCKMEDGECWRELMEMEYETDEKKGKKSFLKMKTMK